jgi:hypothetical protein
MRKNVIVTALFWLLAATAHAQPTGTEQVMPRRFRISFAVTGSSQPALTVDGESLFRNMTALRPACLNFANNVICNSPQLRLATRYDSDTSVAIVEATDEFNLQFTRPSQTALTGEFQLGGWATLYENGWSWPGVSSAPPVAPAFRIRLYYDTALSALRYSYNGGAYTSLSTANIPATTTANFFFAGPASGGAAAPAFRAMVLDDIPNGLITFAKWNQNGCATGNIPKWNGSAWACAGDDTSPGGTSWLTTGNTAGAAGTFLGTLDNFSFDFRTNNAVWGTLNTNGNLNITQTGGRLSIPNTLMSANHGIDIAQTGAAARYWKMGGITACTGLCVSGATEASIYFDLDDSRIYVTEGSGSPVRVTGQAPTLTMPPGFTVTGSGTPTITVAYEGSNGKTWHQWTASQGVQPSTNFATFDVRNDHPVLDFNDAVSDTVHFEAIMPEEYDGGNINVQIRWLSTAATAGDVRWECSIESLSTDYDADSFGTAVLVTTTTNAVAGIVATSSCVHDTAGELDSVAAGMSYRVRIRRIGTDAADTMTSDAELVGVQVRKN